MQTLEVTDEQYVFIQRLRENISESVVGKYGYVREQDAVQFLIDNLDDSVELDADVDSSATTDVAASVGAVVDGEPDPNELESVSYEESDGETTAADAEPTDGSADESGADGGDDADDGGDDADDGGGDADDDDMLNEMMSLLDTHDDKWEESSSADYRYTVTLPDGSSEDVQTKDDVRALLFKNYR
ncbi:hypothetical protein [Natrarchaeobius oligotrophus]|uniref:Uncharacterized protein n=1 Tax=Natrarchaeobius chitinivorans TaxID=1679083 RepID=A0A3N6NKX8_NATCH|nr:hypothetical protein [Natrarchaeobius chitinivorans]RQG99962.1 hypothetical protein EA472_12115 [Natrarchaeobius chitinivorans]